ncbi:Probable zinc-ribbon domain-containing protein [Clostridium sp. DSM 8431]|uniref:zinc-ribbon domain containing protein n=1 Tax=Clostridium sp. DSM 8431 TaxID=1761781 RepID=UPI0008E156ED|nr:zinc-ribbon domain containing protein [Clostridium sp. DSM 8431]SFU90688.1 Probable zinc-ribbon domain-containing protein [Clostridium sp. DSM 8431]
MIKKTCKECKKEFTLSDSEIKFYKDKNLELPKRCKECRDKKKNYKETSEANNTKNNQYIDKQSIDRSSTEKTTGKTNGKILRNIIITAVVIIASFFGINLDFFKDNKPVQNTNESVAQQNFSSLSFRNSNLLKEHFEKHGSEFGYKSEEDYVKGALAVINSPTSLHKTEAEDGDEIYYDKNKNEIVFISKDGYIRTYFKPSDGINYYNRQ